jgi:adenylate cyclase
MATREFVLYLRLGSGLVMLVYVIGHLTNHALGIVSLQAMDAGLAITIAPWRTLPGTVLLYGAVIAHVGTASWSLYQRQTLRLPRWQLWQTFLGLAIPLVLLGHVLATRAAHIFVGVDGNYFSELTVLWVVAPEYGALQAAALVVVWTHGALGIHSWLRLKPWYVKYQAIAFSIFLLLPTLALSGYVAGGMQVRRLARDAAFMDGLLVETGGPGALVDWVESVAPLVALCILAFYLLVFGARAARTLARSRANHPRLYYGDRSEIDIRPGMSVLEVLRGAGVAHPSVCGGNGRCSTCRVHIDRGGDWLAAPAPDEAKVLARISAPASVRLACQLRPAHDLAVSPLLPATATAADAYQRNTGQNSEERAVAILFADIRGFTRFAEDRLPFDVVFVLTRYRSAMTAAIEEAGGVVNEFVGDGIMALFGLETNMKDGCRKAVRAARLMGERLDQLNETLGAELREPLRIGIGIHTGAVIIGEMGHDHLKGITVVGDVVNTASRLEGLTKDFKAQLVISEEVMIGGEIELDGAERHEVEVRGRVAKMVIQVVGRARELKAE